MDIISWLRWSLFWYFAVLLSHGKGNCLLGNEGGHGVILEAKICS